MRWILTVTIMLLSVPALAAVEPWPLMNGPNGAPPSPSPAELAAQAQAQAQAQAAALAEAQLYQQQIQQQQQQRQGSELANSLGGGMSPMSASTPNGNGLDIGGSAPDGPNGMPNNFINACTNEPGKFQFKFGEVKCSNPDSCSKKPAGCDGRLQMSEQLATFMANNLNRCVKEAAGIGGVIQSGKIFHAGTKGDSRHAVTGSLHNVGLAIDVKAIEVNGRTYVYDKNTDPESKRFFDKFRNCWGDAVSKERAGCLAPRSSGMPQGTIACEDPHHHHHMHLSLPVCTAEARAKGLYIAGLEILFPTAHAEAQATEETPYEKSAPPSKFTRKSVKVKGGDLKLTVEDGQGEPLGADHIITLEIECAKKKVPPPAPIVVNACDYTDMKYDAKTNQVTLLFRTSDIVDGLISCRLPQKKQWKLPCE